MKFYIDFEHIIEDYKISISILFVLIFIFWVSLFFPLITIFQIFSGFIFGQYLGTFLSLVSILIGSMLIYHYPLDKISPKILSKKKINLSFLKKKIAKNEFFYLLLIRVLPGFPFFLQGALASYFKVSKFKFILSTVIGLMPICYLINFFGSEINQTLLYSQKLQISFQKDISFYIPFFILVFIYILKFVLIKVQKKFFY
ncbi:VTT domain-containing protein [Alphaproteobacteria bacterium]|nr:VTT domain-containing protein [Alphaproteobacteria bacterium]